MCGFHGYPQGNQPEDHRTWHKARHLPIRKFLMTSAQRFSQKKANAEAALMCAGRTVAMWRVFQRNVQATHPNEPANCHAYDRRATCSAALMKSVLKESNALVHWTVLASTPVPMLSAGLSDKCRNGLQLLFGKKFKLANLNFKF